ncbi:MAG: DUF1150 family protein [Rhodospirillales bacterium]|nr:DUF1150 family protein [Rhodospirillales bacterium]
MNNPMIGSAKNQPPMSSQAFAEWGAGAFAYLKPEHEQGINGYAIYAADGRHLAFVENRDTAKALVLQNQLMPVYVQ